MSAFFQETENFRVDFDGILWLRTREVISEDDWDYSEDVRLGDIENGLTSFDVPAEHYKEYEGCVQEWWNGCHSSPRAYY